MRELPKLLLFLVILVILCLLACVLAPLAALRRGGAGPSRANGGAKHRVLLTAPFPPGSESGGAKAVQDLLITLKDEFEVSTWAIPRPFRGPRLRGAIASLLFRALVIPDSSRRLAFGHAALREAASRADTVVFEFFATAIYLWMGNVRAPRVVVRDHEVLVRKFDMERRAARGIERLTWGIRVATCYVVSFVVYLRADCIIALTEQDRAAIADWFPMVRDRTVHIPAPFEPADFLSPQPKPEDAPVRHLMMVGNFFHSPNVDGLLWFLRECAPHLEPGFTLHLCGLDKPLDGLRLEAPGLKVVRHGFVEDAVAMGTLAPIAIAPIISGGGVRIKNLYLASMGKALVTTPLGNEGIDFADGVHAVLCQDARTMAAQINELARSPSRIALIGTNACAHVRETFRADAILARLGAALYGPQAVKITTSAG